MECLNTKLRALEYASRETVVNVFTVDGKGGNPCPVVLDASSMTPDTMRAVARAHGHESAFVLPLGDAESDFTLRFFVPGHEMEMCGHATLGTLWLMRQAGVIGDRRVRIRTRSGLVFADNKDGNIPLTHQIGRAVCRARVCQNM